MGNSCVLLEVTPGPSQASAVNGLLIAILIERARISCVVYVLVCSGLWNTDWEVCLFIMLRWSIFKLLSFTFRYVKVPISLGRKR